jgi:hypothetical protein
MFIIAGYVQNWIICLAIGVVATVAVAVVLKAILKDKKVEAVAPMETKNKR